MIRKSIIAFHRALVILLGLLATVAGLLWVESHLPSRISYGLTDAAQGGIGHWFLFNDKYGQGAVLRIRKGSVRFSRSRWLFPCDVIQPKRIRFGPFEYKDEEIVNRHCGLRAADRTAHWVISFHLCAPVAIFGAYPMIAFIRGPVRRWRRRRKGKCVTCGYDLTGNVTGTCPECGTSQSRRDDRE
jgi:hypothetical protein